MTDVKHTALEAEMLAALKELLKGHKPGRGQCCAAADMAIDVIAKASGETP